MSAIAEHGRKAGPIELGREMVFDLPSKRRLHGVEFLHRHGQSSGGSAVWQFIDHLVSDVVGLSCRQRIDEALEVHFSDDHLVQGQPIFIGKHGL